MLYVHLLRVGVCANTAGSGGDPQVTGSSLHVTFLVFSLGSPLSWQPSEASETQNP